MKVEDVRQSYHSYRRQGRSHWTRGGKNCGNIIFKMTLKEKTVVLEFLISHSGNCRCHHRCDYLGARGRRDNPGEHMTQWKYNTSPVDTILPKQRIRKFNYMFFLFSFVLVRVFVVNCSTGVACASSSFSTDAYEKN